MYRYFALVIVLSICSTELWAQKTTCLQVETRRDAKATTWNTYDTQTIDCLPGYKSKKEPSTSVYGGWIVKDRQEATGFFRTAKIDNRWWIIDPLGYPFIHKGVAVFRAGGSDRQQEALSRTFGTREVWAQQHAEMLKAHGFNGLGAWSDVNTVRQQAQPLVYTVIVNPMGQYRHQHRSKRFGGKYKKTGWQGYRFDLAMVFDPEFDKYVEMAIAPIAQYKEDKYLLGYFTDNELPWVNDALDRHLTLLAKDEAGYLAAKKWLDQRKGEDARVEDITEEDRLAFSGFYFETYIEKVANAVRKYDPNHLYLGCRFNQHKEELQNPEIFRVAGKYRDIISINHYQNWQPDTTDMEKWEAWSGKPFIITEWYTKGEDSGLPNNTGAGWNVHTQVERGYFYQNFAIELLKSRNCVGWHWFTYQDNDPEDLKTDPSNRDSNKGIVTWDFKQYSPLLDNMKTLNANVYPLIQYFDKNKK